MIGQYFTCLEQKGNHLVETKAEHSRQETTENVSLACDAFILFHFLLMYKGKEIGSTWKTT